MSAAFDIDGKPYEMPLPTTFDIDEAQIYFDYTGVVLEEMWLEGLGWDQLKTRPGFVPALAHVAYRRGNPDVPNDQIRMVIGKQNRAELFGAWFSSISDDEPASEDPKAETDERTSSSPTSSATGSTPNGTTLTPSSSGETSKTSSGRPDEKPDTTGTTGSGGRSTSAPKARVV